MKRDSRNILVDLSGEWSMAVSEQDPGAVCGADILAKGYEVIPAQVPGNVELDLERAGTFTDVFRGMNILQAQELEYSHIWMWRKFDHSPEENDPGSTVFLEFEGIDTYGEVFLNGEHIGSADNMLIEHRFDVTGVPEGTNEVFVHIIPSAVQAAEFDYPPGLVANNPNYQSLYVRKAPHMYGWDIMCRALSGGLWKPVKLVCESDQGFRSCFMETVSIDDERSRAELVFHYNAEFPEKSAEWEVAVTGKSNSSSFEEQQKIIFSRGHVKIDLQDPELWWPAGRGEQSLYNIRASLLKNGHEVDSVSFTYGIRTIRLERTSITDGSGSGEFCFYINGERVFCKGTNWVPLDAFHSRDPERVERAVDLAEECGCNMIRCWGGNVYETDRFFDLCDNKGILVWQDFSMACAVYPQDEDFQNRLAQEAGAVVRRLRHHPCIVLWAGDNECDMFYRVFKRGDPNKNVITRSVIPGVLTQEDPEARPYLPSSPYIDEKAYAENAGLEKLPENHLWGPRNYYKSDYYLSANCHFVSEIGYHGSPCPESVKEFITVDNLWPPLDNEEWQLHSTDPVPGVSTYGTRVELMHTQIRELFGNVPDSLEEFAFLSQAAQAEAKKFFIEHFRSGKWKRTGILWWNLLDGWPQFSDAVVDYYFRKKLAFSVITRAQQQVLPILTEPESGMQRLVVCNDTREDVDLTICIRDIDTGREAFKGNCRAEADAVTEAGKITFAEDEKRFYKIEWSIEGTKGESHYLAGEPPFDPQTYQQWLQKAGFLQEPELGWIKDVFK